MMENLIIMAVIGLLILMVMAVIAVAFLSEFYNPKEYKIFFDDIRTVEMVYGKDREGEFEVVRSVEDFKELIEKRGVPEYISFDHDLGQNEDGTIAKDAYDAVKWMIYVKEYDLTEMKFYVHSDNPVGAENIRVLILNWQKELKRRNG